MEFMIAEPLPHLQRHLLFSSPNLLETLETFIVVV